MTVRTALVIGGGIAGPVTAMALRRAGIEPVVHEAYASTADGVGAMLTVAPNGLAALDVVGAGEAVRAAGQPITDSVLTDGRGRPIGVMRGLEGLPPGRALSRPDLYRVLHELATAEGIRIEYGKRLVDAREDAGGVTARFADGTEASADLLVGADGIRSVVRTLIDPGAPGPAHVPLLNVGATADVVVDAAPDTAYFAFGKRAFLGYWTQPDGTTTWFGNIPHEEPMTYAQAQEVPAGEWHRRLGEIYADDRPGRELVENTPPGRLAVLGTVEIMPKVPRWHRGRMVLVGDAVHAPSPSSGQGASLAAESAVELARCLRDLPEVPDAFAAYERLRRERVQKVAARAARTNNSKTLGPAGLAMMKLMMPLATRTFLSPERTLGPEHRFRIDWGAPVDAAPAGAR
ncbi:FAD-dependent monooxygenase [Actinomadura viridis]|uniref:2-polyprenyl-6-methoxyphenol hydroxylase-like FAD-dependent oxidoreductase n=1 Tax=Actinomadura viridis TaxID=58110 RepID=A0A931DHA5_9ACTN|nr:FAD-dependent monooxygenase [Actinomadura viridis]MBG6087541.1 2-polyprenyl-6-methoxyphenol hydroxylase-like FAD-dependent oxidoreductase [Actinomadura viridis]